MRKMFLIGILFLLSLSVLFAQEIKPIGISYSGETDIISPLETGKWYDIECTYEYKNKADLLSECILLVSNKNDMINGLTVKYSIKSKVVSIIRHGGWVGNEAEGISGEAKIIENDLAYVDCENTKINQTKDNAVVTFRVKFKAKHTGNLSGYLYADATDGRYTGFVYINEVPIGDKNVLLNDVYRTMPSVWVNSLKPKGGVFLNFASNKNANYVIVTPNNPKTKEKKAAYDLAKYFYLMSNVKFDIIEESKYVKGNFISIGNTDLLAKSNSKYKKDNLSTEGYVVDIINNNLYLYGGSGRGLIDGVYSILEEDFGCRWYTNENKEYIPELLRFNVSVAPRKHVPQLDLRDAYVFESWDATWSLRNRSNSPNATIPPAFGGSIKYHFLVHTYAWYIPAGEYYATHPEYFSLVNGTRSTAQLCNSNPEVINIMIEKTKKIFRDDPSATITSVSPNDGRGFCDCPNCKALDDANGGRSGSYFYLVNKVAEGIKDEFPDKKILALAYLDYANPPTNMKIADNVVVQLCTDSHAWKYQFCFTTESDNFQNFMKKWGKSGAGIFIWDYVADYVHMLVPMANMPIVADNMRFYLKNNAKGIMLQGTCYSAGGDMSDMRAWVWIKQMWNPDLDTKTLMKDFIYGNYQECAKPIWNYQMMLWNYWEKYHAMPHKCGEVTNNPLLTNLMCSYAPDGPMFTKEFMDNFWKYIIEAEKLAKTDDMLWRIKKIKASLLYLELAQNVGYMSEFRDFTPGKEYKYGKLNNKEKYEAYYNELKEIMAHWKITNFSEQNDLSKITGKWEEVLAATGESVPKVAMSSEWLFVPDRENKGVNDKWFENQFYYDKAKREKGFGGGGASTGLDADGTARVRTGTGAGWESQGFPGYTGYGWYFQNFTIDDYIKNASHYYLYFGGVDEEATIYINGKLVYEHTASALGAAPASLWNTPFACDIKDYVNPDGINTVAVEVYNSAGMGGIWRPVTLFGSDKVLSASELRGL